MTTATERMTWDNLRLILLADANKAEGDSSRATDEDLRSLARGFGITVRSSASRTTILKDLLAHIGTQPDLHESVETNLPPWVENAWDEALDEEEEIPPYPPMEERPLFAPTPRRRFEEGPPVQEPMSTWARIGVIAAALALVALVVTAWQTEGFGLLGRGDSATSTQTLADQATRATATASVTATATPAAADTGKMPDLPTAASHGKWTIQENADIDKDPIVRDFMSRLKDPDPARWPTFPNIPNPKLTSSEFPVVNGDQVPWGVEYGVDNVPFCQQDTRCDFVVPALHYRLVTADYSFQGVICRGDGKKGCLLMLVNVGNQTQIWRNQMADNGFSVAGRYWDGDHLDTAMWGLVSHASANMLNGSTMASPDKVLNSGDGSTNGGANCGVPNGCQTVDATIVVHAGDRILAIAKSTVTR